MFNFGNIFKSFNTVFNKKTSTQITNDYWVGGCLKNNHFSITNITRWAEGGPRMSVASARTADSARTTKFRVADADLARTRLLKILKHKYLMFFYVLRMRVSPQNAVMQVTLSLQQCLVKGVSRTYRYARFEKKYARF